MSYLRFITTAGKQEKATLVSYNRKAEHVTAKSLYFIPLNFQCHSENIIKHVCFGNISDLLEILVMKRSYITTRKSTLSVILTPLVANIRR